MTSYDFDDSHIPWQRFEEFDHLQYFIFDVDTERLIVDVLFKFAANEQIADLGDVTFVEHEHFIDDLEGAYAIGVVEKCDFLDHGFGRAHAVTVAAAHVQQPFPHAREVGGPRRHRPPHDRPGR